MRGRKLLSYFVTGWISQMSAENLTETLEILDPVLIAVIIESRQV
jgi:hypothetical protein